MIARRSRTLAVLGLVGRVARVTTVVVAGCGEIGDGPSVAPDAPMTVEIDAQSVPPPPIAPLLRFSADGNVANTGMLDAVV